MCGKINPLAPLSPSRKAWMFLCLLSHPKFARKLGTLVTEGYLARTGWVRSVLTERIVDAGGNPLPWMSTPFTDFIEPRLHKGLRIFEYGAGASTLFFAHCAKEVLSVEHDASFAASIKLQLPLNARVVVCAEGSDDYINAVIRTSDRPHLVSVDGRDRVRCVITALHQLAEDGVLVLDDSERPEYIQAIVAIKEAGFRSLEFWGIAPARIEHKCTTVFYREANVLGI